MSRLDAPLPGLIFRKGARRDLTETFEFIGKVNPERAWRFVDAVQKTVVSLLEFPNMGSPRSLSNVPIRELRAWPVDDFKMYVIWYHSLASNDGIEILRVLHHSRDAQTLLSEDSEIDADI